MRYRDQIKAALVSFSRDGDADCFLRTVQELTNAADSTETLTPTPHVNGAAEPRFEVILLSSEGDFARDLLYDVQRELNTGEHGRTSDPTTRCDWNGTPRRFEVIPHGVHNKLLLTVETNSLEEASVLREAAVRRHNELFEALLAVQRLTTEQLSQVEMSRLEAPEASVLEVMQRDPDASRALAKGAAIYQSHALGKGRMARVKGIESRGNNPVDLVVFMINGGPDLTWDPKLSFEGARREDPRLGRFVKLNSHPILVDDNRAYAVCLPVSDAPLPDTLHVLLEPIQPPGCP